jgi:hypothetical protein
MASHRTKRHTKKGAKKAQKAGLKVVGGFKSMKHKKSRRKRG